MRLFRLNDSNPSGTEKARRRQAEVEVSVGDDSYRKDVRDATLKLICNSDPSGVLGSTLNNKSIGDFFRVLSQRRFFPFYCCQPRYT
jgi:hypothetical protein